MCETCDRQSLGRREFLTLTGLGAASLALPARSFAADGATTTVTSDEALAKLRSGNEMYVTAPQICAARLASRRHDVAASQAPWAAIVTCSDSRVVPELVFGGVGVGEIFVMRNAGNIIDTEITGSVEYAVADLGVPLIVVMGHQRCGAIAAACDIVARKARFPGSIGAMVQKIVPAAKAVRNNPGDFLDNTVRENARRGARSLAASKIVAERIKAGKTKILAARYDLEAGTVDYLT